VLGLAFAGVRPHWHRSVLLFVFVVVVLSSIIVSTIISPYEQWLAGGVVVLYDVVLGAAA
jgi:hypothetical protein